MMIGARFIHGSYTLLMPSQLTELKYNVFFGSFNNQKRLVRVSEVTRVLIASSNSKTKIDDDKYADAYIKYRKIKLCLLWFIQQTRSNISVFIKC